MITHATHSKTFSNLFSFIPDAFQKQRVWIHKLPTNGRTNTLIEQQRTKTLTDRRKLLFP